MCAKPPSRWRTTGLSLALAAPSIFLRLPGLPNSLSCMTTAAGSGLHKLGRSRGSRVSRKLPSYTAKRDLMPSFIGRSALSSGSSGSRNGIARVYCIDHGNSSQQLAKLQQLATSLGVPFQHVPLLGADVLDATVLRRSGLVSKEDATSTETLSRSLSHMLVWKDLLLRSLQSDTAAPVLVLESCCELQSNLLGSGEIAPHVEHRSHPWKCVGLSGAESVASAYLMTELGAKLALEANVPLRCVDEVLQVGGQVCSEIISQPPVGSHQQQPTVTVLSENPLVVQIDDALMPEEVGRLRQCFRELQDSRSAEQTRTYVDDIFDADNRAADVAHLSGCVRRSGVAIPSVYENDPVRAFLWLVATQESAVEISDIVPALFMVQKLAFQAKWESEERGRVILAKSRFRSAAKRWKMPAPLLELLIPLLESVFGHGARNVQQGETSTQNAYQDDDVVWQLGDATIVCYGDGQSQVPHMDTADVTVLTYLSSHGGNTCFPNLRCKVAPRAGRVLIFFSTTPETRTLLGNAELPVWDTLHYGELATDNQEGEKLVAQVLMSVRDIGSARTWADTLRGSMFKGGIPRASHWEQYSDDTEGQDAQIPESIFALSRETCTRCNDRALDMEATPGGPKYCLSCWSSIFEASLRARTSA